MRLKAYKDSFTFEFPPLTRKYKLELAISKNESIALDVWATISAVIGDFQLP